MARARAAQRVLGQLPALALAPRRLFQLLEDAGLHNCWVGGRHVGAQEFCGCPAEIIQEPPKWGLGPLPVWEPTVH